MTGPDDVRVGETTTLRTEGPLTVTDSVRYQGASGDMNPIHHDDGFARRAGFEQPFAVGMRQAGVLGTAVAERWGPTSVRRLAVRFRTQAWPGDTLTYTCTVAGEREQDGERLVDLDLAVVRQDGSVHLSGSATVTTGRRPAAG